ncbi:hypothetical protein K461DRAFT_143492 [Myriangium duriaei CBS 260.36]|uniref:Uncharacterized protein n=1 Tax=Myriangium duriaei CBS 260.36 TaxID=1168546 RepID=A0A9P4J4E5_9PEZI|nr:hypothetical protein K461DRAFT_143492 [Myriangium duriaei CBS 260.36]
MFRIPALSLSVIKYIVGPTSTIILLAMRRASCKDSNSSNLVIPCTWRTIGRLEEM